MLHEVRCVGLLFPGDAVTATATRRGVELIPVVREFVADTVTPISAYLALAQAGRSCLLESVGGTEHSARRSFIGLDYLETATFDRDPLMLDHIRALLARYHVTAAAPFAGGAVCTFAYDAARILERIGPRLPSSTAFADAYVVVPGTWVVFDHFSHKAALIGFAPAAAERDAVARRLDAYLARLLAQPPTIPGAVRGRGLVAASMDERTFLERAAMAQSWIYEGDVYQVQVGIAYSCALEGAPFDAYRRIRALNPSPYMFFIDSGDHAVFGASPEFLVRLEGRSARIRPLAGTRPRGESAAADAAIARELLANDKERAEHVMLVDLARNDLGRVSWTGSVRVDELMRIERYSHVMHIVSSVAGELRDEFDALDLFAAAFPAGTVTGAPKVRAMQLIDRLEPVARGLYAGSVAHIDFDGGMDSCITLRSVVATGGRAHWQASAGIVADSDPELEYAEIVHKTRVVRAVLEIAT
jgi:anthranilate synthase component 1